MRLGRYGRNPMWPVTGLVAVVYGLGVAFGGALWGEQNSGTWLMAGAAVVGLLFVVFMVIPFVWWMVKGSPNTG